MPSGLLWAKCNLGAEQEIDYGLYFSWGNTDGYAGDSGHDFGSDADWDEQTQTWGGIYGSTPGGALTDSFTPGDAHDAARAMLGAPWKMPTQANFEELLDTNNCTNEHVDNYNGSGVAGRLFTSVANGNTLFLPYAGCVLDSALEDVGEGGNYWSVSIYNAQNANRLNISGYSAEDGYDSRYIGCSVRAVK